MADRCVVCGQAAGWVIDGSDGRELPVCDEHILPAYKLELYLALRDLWRELRVSYVKDMGWLARLLKRVETAMRFKGQSDEPDRQH